MRTKTYAIAWAVAMMITCAFIANADAPPADAQTVARQAIQSKYGFGAPLEEYAFSEEWTFGEYEGEPCFIITYTHNFLPVKAGLYRAGVRENGNAALFAEWSHDGNVKMGKWESLAAPIFTSEQLECFRGLRAFMVATEYAEEGFALEREFVQQYMGDAHFEVYHAPDANGEFTPGVNEGLEMDISYNIASDEAYVTLAWNAVRDAYGVGALSETPCRISSGVLYEFDTRIATYWVRFFPYVTALGQDIGSYYSVLFPYGQETPVACRWVGIDFWQDAALLMVERGKAKALEQHIGERSFDKLHPIDQVKVADVLRDGGYYYSLRYVDASDKAEEMFFSRKQVEAYAKNVLQQTLPFTEQSLSVYTVESQLLYDNQRKEHIYAVRFAPTLAQNRLSEYWYEISPTYCYARSFNATQGSGPVAAEQMLLWQKWARAYETEHGFGSLWSTEGEEAYRAFQVARWADVSEQMAEIYDISTYSVWRIRSKPDDSFPITVQEAIATARAAKLEKDGEAAYALGELHPVEIVYYADNPDCPVWLVAFRGYAYEQYAQYETSEYPVREQYYISAQTGDVVRFEKIER